LDNSTNAKRINDENYSRINLHSSITRVKPKSKFKGMCSKDYQSNTIKRRIDREIRKSEHKNSAISKPEF
jgi:hypothetical protein